MQNILVTGGAGFIGANFINYIFEKTDFKGIVVNMDKLTYAGNLENVENVAKNFPNNYFFEQVDICDYQKVDEVFKKYNIDTVVHFAAESHVDRSILGPGEFVNTNINGTYTLLEVARKFWADRKDTRFHHISTDEVYGSLGSTGYFYETTPYDPRSPYSASKASSDHLVEAYKHTYNMNITKSNCSNNYGPLQFPEKLIPLLILNILDKKPLPIYGDGLNVRDWLFVEDHCSAIWTILNKGVLGETYNIGGECERTNLQIVNAVCSIMAKKTNQPLENITSLITFVKDRPGHDRRYAINCDKIKSQLNWKQSVDFEQGLEKTIDWYLSNSTWIKNILSGEYQNWINKNYQKR